MRNAMLPASSEHSTTPSTPESSPAHPDMVSIRVEASATAYADFRLMCFFIDAPRLDYGVVGHDRAYSRSTNGQRARSYERRRLPDTAKARSPLSAGIGPSRVHWPTCEVSQARGPQ